MELEEISHSDHQNGHTNSAMFTSQDKLVQDGMCHIIIKTSIIKISLKILCWLFTNTCVSNLC